MNDDTLQQRTPEDRQEKEKSTEVKIYAWLLILYALGMAVLAIEYLASHANI